MCAPRLMTGDTYVGGAATHLSILIVQFGTTPDGLKSLIRNRWGDVCKLAYLIHDEETSNKKKFEEAASTVATTSIANLVRALTEAEEFPKVRAALKLLAAECK